MRTARAKLFAIAAWLLAGLVGAGCLSGWAKEDAPSDADLYAVFGVEGGDVWAVGAGGTVLVRQGTTWTQLDSGVDVDLHGVWGTGAEHVVVVGDACTALQFDGQLEPPEDGGGMPPDLRPLEVEGCPQCCPDDCSPDVDCWGFSGMSGDSPTGANAVGGRRIYWYNGQQITQGGAHADNLLGVHRNAGDDIYICGDNGLIRHNDGDAWNTSEVALCPVELVDGACPTDPEKPILYDIWVGTSGVGAAVGNSGGLFAYPPPAEGEWPSADTGLSGTLRAVHGRDVDGAEFGAEVWAVGDSGAVFRMRGAKLSRQDVGTNEDLHGVWVSADGQDVYAVGLGGVIAHLHK